ncbi:MAG: phage integrase N-terminal SAM-like domain-containing protein [Candidatus Sabulitectum sp.]|nr:phage integrase N-terminal SAM-like domain-containing protein [Candidatus Sabulitectum sp.]
MKIKHYAHSTEKSYMQWCSRYFGYCERNKLSNDSDAAFRDYLTHFALLRKTVSSVQNQHLYSSVFVQKCRSRNR